LHLQWKRMRRNKWAKNVLKFSLLRARQRISHPRHRYLLAPLMLAKLKNVWKIERKAFSEMRNFLMQKRWYLISRQVIWNCNFNKIHSSERKIVLVCIKISSFQYQNAISPNLIYLKYQFHSINFQSVSSSRDSLDHLRIF
jgi:hypothetical protein